VLPNLLSTGFNPLEVSSFFVRKAASRIRFGGFVRRRYQQTVENADLGPPIGGPLDRFEVEGLWAAEQVAFDLGKQTGTPTSDLLLGAVVE
jgi:hypothetical protein